MKRSFSAMLVVGLATITFGLEAHAASQALPTAARYDDSEFGANRGNGDVLERHRY